MAHPVSQFMGVTPPPRDMKRSKNLEKNIITMQKNSPS